ncbi:MAG: class I SAM-dependent methyltransferase [Candidatus Hydrogenedentes bacterium]|nr:class I SAM-dependent methyltransferase [Candidatus Hydrogenedentota bacterium]
MEGDNAARSPEHPKISSSWFKRAFGDLYPVVYAHRTVEAARPEAQFAARMLALREADSLLDIGCGSGRHLIHLCDVCGHCSGLDYSPDLLAEAREQLGHNVLLVRADMRAIPFDATFDVVVNFFTSFGYFFAEEDNLKVIRELVRVLKPGGRYFIDYMNAKHARSTLKPSSSRTSEGYEIRETRWIDLALRRVNKSTRVLKDGMEVEHTSESVRLYEQEEFVSMLRGAGLSVDQCYGNYAGAPLSDDQPRMIVIGKKV